MPYEIAFDEPVGCYFVVWTGTIRLIDWQAFRKDIAGRPWFRPGLNGLHDHRRATFTITRSEILDYATTQELLKSAFGVGRAANVMRDQKGVALVRDFALVAGGDQRMIEGFTDYQAAKAWLELPTDYVAPFGTPEGEAE